MDIIIKPSQLLIISLHNLSPITTICLNEELHMVLPPSSPNPSHNFYPHSLGFQSTHMLYKESHKSLLLMPIESHNFSTTLLTIGAALVELMLLYNFHNFIHTHLIILIFATLDSLHCFCLLDLLYHPTLQVLLLYYKFFP